MAAASRYHNQLNQMGNYCTRVTNVQQQPAAVTESCHARIISLLLSMDVFSRYLIKSPTGFEDRMRNKRIVFLQAIDLQTSLEEL